MGKSRKYAIEHDSKNGSTDDKQLSQVEQFRALARELGTDESEAAFDRALRKVASAPPAPMHKSDKGRSHRKLAKKQG